jgi:hypothetical protein
MARVAFFVVIASFVALLVVGTEDMGSGHTLFANRATSGHVAFTNKGINVQTDTNQDQGCEAAGGTSGITNACTATSGPGSTETSTETSVTLRFSECATSTGQPGFECGPANNCNNIGCQFIFCPGQLNNNAGDCTTDNGVQLTSCAVAIPGIFITCTRTVTTTVPGTGITQSGGVTN